MEKKPGEAAEKRPTEDAQSKAAAKDPSDVGAGPSKPSDGKTGPSKTSTAEMGASKPSGGSAKPPVHPEALQSAGKRARDAEPAADAQVEAGKAVADEQEPKRRKVPPAHHAKGPSKTQSALMLSAYVCPY